MWFGKPRPSGRGGGHHYSYADETLTRQGNSHPTLFPYDAFETVDGFVVIAAFSNDHWRALCEAMGRPDLVADHPTPDDRLAAREYLEREISAWTADYDTDAVVSTLQGAVPVAPVQTVADVFADPHVEARDMLATVEQPGADQSVTIAGTPIKMSETPPRPRGRAPLLDEHRESILDETFGGRRDGSEDC
ncbi:MAG: succinyl-CoA:mesaconate CoA transferase [Halobacteriales archaeon]